MRVSDDYSLKFLFHNFHDLAKFYVYIIYSKTKDKFYIGSTQNIEERISKHNNNHKGFTGKNNDWELKYVEEFEDKYQAMQRENEIKRKKSRKYIEWLVLGAKN